MDTFEAGRKKKGKKSQKSRNRGGSEPRARRQRCDKRWMPWFMGSSARLGRGQFPLAQFGLTVKALWRPAARSTDKKKKRKKRGLKKKKGKEAEKLCSIQNTCQELEQKRNTALLFYTKFLSHRSPHFPSSIIPLVTAHRDTEKILFFHIIGMRNGLELNSITYSNPQTNKSNIAQGQNAFYVSKSQNKRARNKKISQHTVFLSYFL